MTEEQIVTDDVGYEEGDVCNRNGCKGVIEAAEVENCSCHINPPCSACVNAGFNCPECEWSSEEE